jgi:hypothetical protein
MMRILRKSGNRFSRRRLEVVIARHFRQIKVLDIFHKKVYSPFNPHTFSHPVNFQHNLNLPEMAMKACRQKVLKVKPPRDFGSLLEAFSFGG